MPAKQATRMVFLEDCGMDSLLPFLSFAACLWIMLPFGLLIIMAAGTLLAFCWESEALDSEVIKLPDKNCLVFPLSFIPYIDGK